MTWTTDKPTVSGAWWHRASGELDFPEIVTLTSVASGTDFWVHYTGLAEGDYLSDMRPNDEWAGPILPPKEEV